MHVERPTPCKQGNVADKMFLKPIITLLKLLMCSPKTYIQKDLVSLKKIEII